MSKTIALCMIVKNEEQYLRRCLDSVKHKVNQIIIVDTGSTDATVDIGKEYTKEIYNFTWINDFSAARNEAIKYATSDYILIMDADEYLDKDSDLQADVSSGSDYYFLRVHNILSEGRQIDHTSVRLFANHRGLFFRNRLHEHLNTLDEDKSFTKDFGNSAVYHTGYTDEMMQDRDKQKRNLPLMLQEVKENPNAYNLFNMGRTYKWIGEYEKAIQYFQRAYPLSANLTIVPELLSNLSQCLVSLNRKTEALQVLNDATVLYPNETDLLHVHALLFKELGYVKDATLRMESCLKLGDQGLTVTEGNGSYMAHYRLAELHESNYRLSESYEHIIESVKTKKDFVAGIAKYFQIVTMASIPQADVYQNFNQIYRISAVKKLKALLEVLYALRHPILNRYLSDYKINPEDNVLVVATQYDKQYDKAKLMWLGMENIDAENGEDILLLSLILKDSVLFELSRSYLNLSVKEAKVLRSIIMNHEIDTPKFTTYLENILEKLADRLLVLQEYEIFQSILEYIWLGSSELKYNTLEKMMRYGFNEVAIDLLVKLFEVNPTEEKIIRLLGDACLNSGYLEDAQLLYTKLLDLSPEYSSYERCYRLYEQLEDKEMMKNIVDSIKNKFPLCLWVHEIGN
ncbi:glycosyltransferase [Paenibacillus polymyxa]|uniref:glycosyltransferase n=1 Tax=Paenibacillus polymyxa TaxID=1406 RepID=UPI00287F449E|nr:glycosyltransferase [Paenibacillus polymyxa]